VSLAELRASRRRKQPVRDIDLYNQILFRLALVTPRSTVERPVDGFGERDRIGKRLTLHRPDALHRAAVFQCPAYSPCQQRWIKDLSSRAGHDGRTAIGISVLDAPHHTGARNSTEHPLDAAHRHCGPARQQLSSGRKMGKCVQQATTTRIGAQ